MNEVLTKETNTFIALAPENAVFTPKEIYEEMAGDMPAYPRIVIPAGGVTTFEVPGDDPENPDALKELKCVIAYHHKANAFWSEEDPVMGQQPDCFSQDGVNGTGEPGGSCAQCPLNAFGSGTGGIGKACKNTERLYLLLEGSILPYMINVSPASLKSYRVYKTLCLTKGKKVCDVVTTISLKKTQNKNGQPYSEIVFKMSGLLDEVTLMLSRGKREEMKVMAESGVNAFEGFTEITE